MQENQSTAMGLFVDLTGSGPAHRRLAHALRSAIQDGRLRPGQALPASRVLAADLGLSRWVVTEAYTQLTAEGYLATRPGSATRVAAQAVSAASPRGPAPTGTPRPDPIASGTVTLDLRPGLPDLASFPRNPWARAHAQVLRRVTAAELGYPDPRGCQAARDTLAGYLRRVRGIDIHPDRLIVTASTTHSMAILSRALTAHGITTLATEDPGWPRLPHVAADHGLRVVEADVDDDGVRVSDLPAARAAALVTPAHQFPTGVPLTAARRTALVEWADRHDGLLVEDDYDAEFRYDRRPLGALAGLNPDRVSYLGSVSKTLAPGMRLAWMVPPAWLLPTVLLTMPDGAGPGVLDQLALAELIDRGDYDRHLRRMRHHYRQRRDAFVDALHDAAPQVRIRGAAAGLHLLLDLADEDVEAVTTAKLQRSGIDVTPLSRYRRRAARAGLVLSYARLPVHRAAEAARAVGHAVRETG